MWQFVKDEDNFVMWGANVAFLMKIINIKNNNVLRRGAPMWQVVKDEDNFVMSGANVTFLMKIINNIRYNRSFTAKSKQECVNVAIC